MAVPLDPTAPLDVDVLVVGAGLSGIDVACRLGADLPGATWAVLEARERLGGTWDLFRYPGIRTDSDMYTLGFPFRPWRGAGSFTRADAILGYLEETAREHGVLDRMLTGQRVERLAWSGEHDRWTVTARTATGTVEHTARFVYLATGYYSYESGHVVDLPGAHDFGGDLVHPQAWPEDTDVRGRHVVVLGSGATAVTLVPALLEAGAAHVTMLQRSPGYVVALPSRDGVADALRRVLPAGAAHRVVRARNVARTQAAYALLRRFPRAGARLLRRGVERALPAGFDVDRHFTPRYAPWDQRLCVAPDGDFFEAIASGRADVVTDTVERLEPHGIRLASGDELATDLLVTATGLRLQLAGGAEVVVDGEVVDPGSRHVYGGVMLSGVPNLGLAVGYTNASWTLRADLSARWFVRLLRRMRRDGHTVAVPRYDESPAGERPLLDLTAGYVRRAEHLLPRQGRRRPWRVVQSYPCDVLETRLRPLADRRLERR